MAQSIIQTEKRCIRCGRTDVLHVHHCLAGSYRKKAEEYGLKIYLCPLCHQYIHDHEEGMRHFRKMAQLKAMEFYGWTEDEFRKHIGRSFL